MATWSVSLASLSDKSVQEITTRVRRATLQLFTNITYASPVRSGRFRNNWNVSLDDPSYAFDMTRGAGTRLEVQLAMLQKFPVGHVVHLVNNVPYAARLEDGWSPQAAPGQMVAANVARWPALLAKSQ